MSYHLSALLLLFLVYLVALYPLLRMFLRMIKLLRATPGNGLEFYRKLVTISLGVSILDGAYFLITFYANQYLPNDTQELLWVATPVVLKSVVALIIWMFYSLQTNSFWQRPS